MILVTKIFLLALIAKKLVQAYLDQRNRIWISGHREEVPARFKEVISLDEHQKAADYSIAKIKMGNFFQLFDTVVLLIWTLGGGIDSLSTLALSLNFGPIGQGVVIFLGFFFISGILGLPQSIYSTFVLEERFGFNKTTPKIFVVDLIKGVFLGLILGVPLLYALLWIINSLGDSWWLWGFTLVTGFQFLLLWAYPVLIAPLFNKFTPLEEGDTKNRVLALLERTGFASKGLFVMDASRRSAHGNAYFTGFGKNKRIVFFDNLIQGLAAPEVEAVLAHELGHFKKRHVLKQLIKGVVLGFVSFYLMGQLIHWPLFYTGHGVHIENPAVGLLLFMIVSGVYTFWLTPLQSYISRKYEFEADEFASKNSSAQDLISALIKLYKENASTLTPDPFYSQFYHSHPPALTRVEFLESLGKTM